jgi:hypothetical protein
MIKLTVALACLAWSGAAITSATPAQAIAATYQTGDYGACSAWTQGGFYDPFCQYYMSYVQQIKFVETQCNGGQCNSDEGEVYVEFQYSTGRTVAVYQAFCQGYNIYAMDTCGC